MNPLSKLKGLVLLFLVLLTSYAFLQNNDDQEIVAWEVGKPLSWEDFQAEPDESSHLHAYTRVGMKTDFISANGNEAELSVKGYFEKGKSWVKPDQKTAGLLNHEQRHFDICELYRRKLKKQLSEFDGFNYKNFSQEANRIFNEVFQEFTIEQKRYDQETQHSKLKEKQKSWEAYIDEELDKLKKFKGQKVIVQVKP